MTRISSLFIVMFRLTLLSSLLSLGLAVSATAATTQTAPTAPETREPTQLTGPVLKALLTGHLYTRQQNYDEAYQAYETAYELLPSATTAKRMWTLAVKAHDDKKVIQSVERWEATNPAPNEQLTRAKLASAIALRNPQKIGEAFRQLADQMEEPDFDFFEGALQLVEQPESLAEPAYRAIEEAVADATSLNALFLKALLSPDRSPEACTNFETAVKAIPADEEMPEVINRAALVCWEVDPKRAQTMLEDHVKGHQGEFTSPDAQLLLARALVRNGQVAQGEEILKTMESNFIDTRMFLYNAATISLEAHDGEAAKRYLNKYLALVETDDPERYQSDNAHRLLASIYRRAGDEAGAEKALQKLTKGKHASAALKERVRLLASLQKYKAAVDLAREGVVRFPEERDDYGLLALIWLPYTSDANHFAREVVSIAESADSAKVSFLVVDVLTTLHRTDLAQYVLTQTFPKAGDPRLKTLAKVLINVEQGEAMSSNQKELDALFAALPMDADVLATYGKFLVKKNRPYEGIAFLHTSLKYQFNAFRALALIEALKRSGRKDEAQAMAQQLIERTQVPLITHFARQAQGQAQ